MKRTIIRTKAVAMVVLLLLISKAGKAQYDALFTQYMFNEMFINPGYAGSREAMSATLLHRQQWVNFAGRPVTTSFSLHGPLMNNKMGLGISVINETIGVLTRNLLYASYAYRIKTSENGRLAFGLMGGLETQMNKFSTLKVSDNGIADPQFSQNNVGFQAPNFGAGIYYNTKTFYAGLSIPRMINNQVKYNGSGADVKTTKIDFSKFTYYITAGNVFKLNEDLKLKANGMLKVVQNAPLQFDIGANLLIKDLIWAGLSYRSNSALAVILGVQVNKQFLVSYSYDYGLNKIQSYSQGSHEIAINYLFAYKGRKIVTPRYF